MSVAMWARMRFEVRLSTQPIFTIRQEELAFRQKSRDIRRKLVPVHENVTRNACNQQLRREVVEIATIVVGWHRLVDTRKSAPEL